ncbi:MAG: dockerin type I domain-containing protein, partial [Rhodopirellula sp. JB053]
NVGGVNNQPEFFGVRGQEGQTTLEFEERRAADESVTFDLTSWFTDADGDVLSFPQPTVADTDLFTATTDGDQLTLNFIPFAFGTTTLTVRASDSLSPAVTQEITVTVLGRPDSPIVAGSLQPLEILEDGVATADLQRDTEDGQGLFFDPDGDVLTYRVRRIGSINNPTDEQIAANSLVESIEFVGDTLQITPKPDQSGSVQIEIEATDGTFVNSHSFDFVVLAAADAPRGNVTPSGDDSPDAYSVPVGGSLRITDPSLGLLRNDFDPDPGSSIRIAPGSLTQPAGGTGTVDLLGRDDGAFSFTAGTVDGSQPAAGQTDTFTYRLIDDTGRLSAPITVNVTFNQSSYQNPVERYDVSADGFVTAVDALRVLNLINARGTNTTAFSVSELTTSPPDYYDVNGDGFISTVDVLQVINELNARDANGNNGSSEPIAPTTVSVSAATTGGVESSLASTQTFASGSTANLGSANAVLRSSELDSSSTEQDPSSSLDQVLTLGMDLQSGGEAKAAQVADTLASDLGSSTTSDSETSGQATDSALLDLFSDSFETD